MATPRFHRLKARRTSWALPVIVVGVVLVSLGVKYHQRVEQERLDGEIAQSVEDYEKGGPEATVAVETLRRIGPAKLTAVLNESRDTTGSRAEAAIAALGALGPDAREAVPALIDALKSRDRSLPRVAAKALGRIGPDAKAAAPALVSILTAKSSFLGAGREAVEALGRIGPDAKEAVPALVDVLVEDEVVRGQDEHVIVNALRRIDPDWTSSASARAAVLRLVDRLAKPDAPVVHRAAVRLRAFGPEAAVAVPALITLLSDRNDAHRALAAGTLWAIGSRAAAAAPALVIALNDPDVLVRVNAADALGAIGVTTEAVVSALVKALDDRGTKWSAVDALGKLGPGAVAAVPALERIVPDEQQHPTTRGKVTAALDKIRKR